MILSTLQKSKIKNRYSIFVPSTSFSNATRAYLQSAPSYFLPLQLKLPFPFQPSSTLSHESNNSINTSKIKNRYSIFFLLPHSLQPCQGIFAIRPFILPPYSNSNCPFPFSLQPPLSAINQNPIILSTLQKSKIDIRYSSFFLILCNPARAYLQSAPSYLPPSSNSNCSSSHPSLPPKVYPVKDYFYSEPGVAREKQTVFQFQKR